MRTRLIFCHQISLKFFIRWTKDKTFIFWYIFRRHWRWQSPVFDRKLKAYRHSRWFEHRHVHTSLMLFMSQLKTLTFVDAEHGENIFFIINTERKKTFLTFLINFKILHVKKKTHFSRWIVTDRILNNFRPPGNLLLLKKNDVYMKFFFSMYYNDEYRKTNTKQYKSLHILHWLSMVYL
jgi:hypothetical protein